MSLPSVSVVVGFKNWGADRLELSARSIIRSFGTLDAELIISDFGSDDATIAEKVAGAVGATVIRTVGDTVWSRSRALNAGFAESRGQLLISTDADMVFSPQAIQTIYRWYEQSPGSAYFLQCRDLPREVTTRLLGGVDIEAIELESMSRLRPRWGMGGMMAISRSQFAAMRGFDERLHTYGREDMDFALRARRAGYRNIWVEAPEARMYHMWHEPALAPSAASDSIRTAVARNRRLVDEDETWVRNVPQWRYPMQDGKPLIRVVLLNASAGTMTEQTLRSLQAQSVGDWEAVVVIDPTDSALEQWLCALGEMRVVVLKMETRLLFRAAATSIINSSAGFITFVDSGCILPPEFLETQISSFATDVRAVSGRQVGLQEIDRQESANELRNESAPVLGTVFHGPIARKIAEHAGDEFRLSQLPSAIESVGRTVIRNTNSVFFTTTKNPDLPSRCEIVALEGLEAYMPYLPDGYINRVLNIHEGNPDLELVAFDGALYGRHLKRDGETVKSAYHLADATYGDMARLRTRGIRFSVRAGGEAEERKGDIPSAFLREVIEVASQNVSAPARAVVVVDGGNLEDIQPALGTVVSLHNTGPQVELFTAALVVFTDDDLQKALTLLGGRASMVLDRYTNGDGNAD